jgi:hypothetical protein
MSQIARKSKTARRAKKPSRPLRAGKPDAVEELAAASAKALALRIDPAWQAGVRLNLQLILIHAALVDEFSLPDQTEPAPVFRA